MHKPVISTTFYKNNNGNLTLTTEHFNPLGDGVPTEILMIFSLCYLILIWTNRKPNEDQLKQRNLFLMYLIVLHISLTSRYLYDLRLMSYLRLYTNIGGNYVTVLLKYDSQLNLQIFVISFLFILLILVNYIQLETQGSTGYEVREHNVEHFVNKLFVTFLQFYLVFVFFDVLWYLVIDDQLTITEMQFDNLYIYFSLSYAFMTGLRSQNYLSDSIKKIIDKLTTNTNIQKHSTSIIYLTETFFTLILVLYALSQTIKLPSENRKYTDTILVLFHLMFILGAVGKLKIRRIAIHKFFKIMHVILILTILISSITLYQSGNNSVNYLSKTDTSNTLIMEFNIIENSFNTLSGTLSRIDSTLLKSDQSQFTFRTNSILALSFDSVSKAIFIIDRSNITNLIFEGLILDFHDGTYTIQGQSNQSWNINVEFDTLDRNYDFLTIGFCSENNQSKCNILAIPSDIVGQLSLEM